MILTRKAVANFWDGAEGAAGGLDQQPPAHLVLQKQVQPILTSRFTTLSNGIFYDREDQYAQGISKYQFEGKIMSLGSWGMSDSNSVTLMYLQLGYTPLPS